MNLVLFELRESLLCFSQLRMFSRSLFMTAELCSDFDELRVVFRVVSSAYDIIFNEFEAFDMSLMYIKKRRGPKIDPCGTPVVRGRRFYWVSS